MSIKVSFREDRNRYQVDYFLDGKRHRPLFNERVEAENFARRLNLGLSPENRDSISIDEAGKKYFEGESQKKSRGSRSNDKRYINLLFHFMTYERGLEKLGSIALDDMEAFRDWLSHQKEFDGKPLNMGHSTINRCMAMMKRFFIKHVQWKNISDSPCKYLDFLESDEKSRAAMSGDQYLKALEKCPDWFKPAMQFMYLTGAPGSCVERLEWNHVDFQTRNYFLIRKKGKKAKLKKIPLPMTDQVFALLIMLRNQDPKLDGSVFKSEYGLPLSAQWVSKVGNGAIKDAGIKGVTLYGLRHALASDLTNANVATEIVRQALGHGSILTTQRYANKLGVTSIRSAIEGVRGVNLVTNEEIERRRLEDGVNEKKLEMTGG